MKETANQYVALDVHQASLVVSVREESGSVRMRATVPTEQKAIVDLLRGLSGRIHVAFEEGTQSQWLHDVIKPHAERVESMPLKPGTRLVAIVLRSPSVPRLAPSPIRPNASCSGSGGPS